MTALQTILDRLERFYGALASPPRDLFGVFVWQVLAARTTPPRRDLSFGALKRMRALTPDALARAAPAKLAAAVALAGPYQEQRLQALRTGAAVLRRSPGTATRVAGPLPVARRALAAMPRLEPADPRVMLLFAADCPVLPHAPPLVRVAARLGYATGPPEGRGRRVARALAGELPQGDPAAFRRAFLYLSHHAAVTCADDPHCRACPVLDCCPEGSRRRRGVSSATPPGAGSP
jgi:endonuclease III